jgi:hypothetical protein
VLTFFDLQAATSSVIAPLRRPHMSLTQKTCKLKAFARNMQVIANSRLPARSFIDRLRSMARASFERLEFEQQAEELKWPLQRTGNLPNQESLEKLLKLCEQKHGRDAPAMRQLRRQLDAIRKPELKAMQQFAPGRGMAFQAVPINTPVLESPKLSVDNSPIAVTAPWVIERGNDQISRSPRNRTH